MTKCLFLSVYIYKSYQTPLLYTLLLLMHSMWCGSLFFLLFVRIMNC